MYKRLKSILKKKKGQPRPTKICVIFHFILKIIFFKKKEEEANAKPEARHNRAQLCFAHLQCVPVPFQIYCL